MVKKNPFYGDDYLSYPFAQDFWNTRNYLPQAAVCALKGGTYNETHFDNAKFAGLIAAAQQEIDEAKRTALLQDAQEIEYNEGGYIIWGFRRQVDGYSAKVSGHRAEPVPPARAPTSSRPSRSRPDPWPTSRPSPTRSRRSRRRRVTPRRRRVGRLAGPAARPGGADAVAGLDPGLRRHRGAG